MKILIITITIFFAESVFIFSQEIVISDVSARCVDTSFVQVSHVTKSYPEHRSESKKIDRFYYELHITVKIIGGNFFYDKTLMLKCTTPDGTSEKRINQELLRLIPDTIYNYKMIISSKTKGWAKITIAPDDNQEINLSEIKKINFVGYSFYLD